MRTTNQTSSPGHSKLACRLCGSTAMHSFVDLGMSPLCQTHISPDQLGEPEPFYPLHALVCSECLLVQLQQFVSSAEIFSEYAYFSSFSDSWVEHARVYAEEMSARLMLGSDSLVAEIASNDGYLLQHFVRQGVPVLGIEPAANVAEVARSKGVRTEVAFFGRATAGRLVAEFGQADLLIGNNVLAHVPDLNDFVAGLKVMLKPQGTLTMEFPHLQRLVEGNQFDTIYHEHFSYFSFLTACATFERHGLTVFDVEELATHGGSLRVHVRHAQDQSRPTTARRAELLERERLLGYASLEGYRGFGEQVKATKRALLRLLIDLRQSGKTIAGYGAPGKGNTLLNYCGIRTDFLDYTVDRNPYKQGKYTPGTRIPILEPAEIARTQPDYVLILPWNLKTEIKGSLEYIREWGGRFIIPIPEPTVVDR